MIEFEIPAPRSAAGDGSRTGAAPGAASPPGPMPEPAPIPEPESLPEVDAMPTGAYRPDDPNRGLGRLFRRVIGMREEVLDWAPEERPRYTRLGAIVINTGLMAALSLLVGLNKVIDTGAGWLALVPIGAFWGFLVISFDGWMIASTHGALNAARLRLFIPRLFISVLMGAVIAEPLLLWVFHPAIQKVVLDGRRDELTAYESTWKKCNPSTGPLVGETGCAGFLLNIKDSPEAQRGQLTDAIAHRDTLKTTVDQLHVDAEAKETFARNECAGTKGAGLTGVPGDGAECARNRKIADDFVRDSRLVELQGQLTDLNQQVTTLTDNVATANTTYTTEIATEIADKVAGKRADQGSIGILDEDRALGVLASQSAVVWAGQWLVRLLLIAIDCLPVLAKMLGGTTTYDRLLARQLSTAQRLHEKYLAVREQRDNAVGDVRIQQTDHERHARMERIDEAGRAVRTKRQEDLDAEIEELAERLRGGR